MRANLSPWIEQLDHGRAAHPLGADAETDVAVVGAGQVRQIGADPANPALLYNLGCNGVGFLSSIYGGQRLARIVAGERLAPSLFDPR